jgi:hypothetical protein
MASMLPGTSTGRRWFFGPIRFPVHRADEGQGALRTRCRERPRLQSLNLSSWGMDGMLARHPSDQQEHVRRFKTESEAKNWIARKSKAWLKKRDYADD